MHIAEQSQSPFVWSIAALESVSDEQQRLFWLVFETTLAEDDGTAVAHLAAGRAIYTRERDTPPGYVIKSYPDGRRELVEPAKSAEASERLIAAIA